MRFIFVLSILIFSNLIGLGQIIDIDEVIVTGSKNSQRLRDTGRNIQIITRQEIQQIPAQSVDDLLRALPGVEVQSRGGFGVQGDITLRGGTFNQVVILIDGARLYDPLTGHFNGYIPISIAEIESIEIIKGAATTLYGPDAVGGVINIITKMTSDSDSTASAEIKTGSYDYLGLEAGLFQNKSKWKIGGGIQVNQATGQERANPNFNTIVGSPETYTSNFDLKNYSLAIGRQITPLVDFYVRSSYDRRSFDAKYFYTASPYDESVENTQIVYNQLHIQRRGENNKTVADFTHRYGDDEFIFNPLFAKNFNRSQFYQFQVHHSRVPNDKLKIGFGLQSDYRLVFSTDRGDHSNLHHGVYTTANYYLEKLTINGGLRADYDDSYDLEWSPSLSFAYLFEKINIRGSINRAIRAADFTERFVSTNLDFLSPERNLGNPNLQAESSWNYELGFDFQTERELLFNLTLFTRNASELIDYTRTISNEINNVNVGLTDSSFYFYSKNIASVTTSGMEIELRYHKQLTDKYYINLLGGYTFLDSKNPNGELSKYVSNHSKHLVNGMISFGNKSTFTLFVQGLWKDRKTVFSDVLGLGVKKDYLTLNTGVRIRPFGNNIQFSFEANNIGDVIAQDIYGSVLPGRWFVGSIKIWI